MTAGIIYVFCKILNFSDKLICNYRLYLLLTKINNRLKKRLCKLTKNKEILVTIL